MIRSFIRVLPVIGLLAFRVEAAVVPNSNNPAHCIAAFSYYAHLLRNAGRPELATEMLARGMYEKERITTTGGSWEKAKADVLAVTEAYARDAKQMDALFVACGETQDRDLKFKSRLPQLLENARAAGAK